MAITGCNQNTSWSDPACLLSCYYILGRGGGGVTVLWNATSVPVHSVRAGVWVYQLLNLRALLFQRNLISVHSVINARYFY